MSTGNGQSRLPYHGSCHCGFIRYVAFIPMPPAVALGPDVGKWSRAFFYKCNCSTCHKTGFFHLRLPKDPNSFYLLSPLDFQEKFLDYQCFDRFLHWYFCPKCGVRCFIASGEWKQEEVDYAAVAM